MHRPAGNTLPDREATRPTRSAGFTVIELIVCLGVVAVLCGILLPSLRATREASQRLACASNMRQVGVAMSAYAMSNDNRIPHSKALDAPVPNIAELMVARINTPDGGKWDGIGHLMPYLGQCNCLYCPSHHGEHHLERYAKAYQEESNTLIFTNYHYSGHREVRQGRADTGTPITLDASPQALLLTDGLRMRSDFNHVTGLNRLFTDLSVSWWADEGNWLRLQLPESDLVASLDSSAAQYQQIWTTVSEE